MGKRTDSVSPNQHTHKRSPKNYDVIQCKVCKASKQPTLGYAAKAAIQEQSTSRLHYVLHAWLSPISCY
eukprot:6342773-Amphidinium_carterae.2